MEILETIPIYGIPTWVTILIVCSMGTCLLSLIFCETKYACYIIFLIGMLGLLTGLVCTIVLHNAEFKRNEYIVRITDMPTQEFIENYEVVKRFDYSDVIQVKEIEKK